MKACVINIRMYFVHSSIGTQRLLELIEACFVWNEHYKPVAES
jgi:hypothetical protein